VSFSPPYPAPGSTLPVLELRTRPDYVGFVPRVVGVVVRIAELGVASSWAQSFNESYHTTIRGSIYSPPGLPVSDSLLLHERVHGWQEKQLGSVAYYCRYATPSGRLALEAQAYASEVVAGYRSFDHAVESITKPVYWPEPWASSPPAERASSALSDAVQAWGSAGHDSTSIRALCNP